MISPMRGLERMALARSAVARPANIGAAWPRVFHTSTRTLRGAAMGNGPLVMRATGLVARAEGRAADVDGIGTVVDGLDADVGITGGGEEFEKRSGGHARF